MCSEGFTWEQALGRGVGEGGHPLAEVVGDEHGLFRGTHVSCCFHVRRVFLQPVRVFFCKALVMP